jgi:hypothetical protein
MVYVVRSVLLGIKIAHAPVMVHGLLKGELPTLGADAHSMGTLVVVTNR